MEYYGEIKILSHDNMDESNKQNQKEKKKPDKKEHIQMELQCLHYKNR